MPAVSVIIPVYNRGEALRPTVDSVLAQSFGDWELIVVDDGSRDHTAEVVRSYTDPRVRYVRQENAGHSAARNHGLRLASGEFIAFLDHDDRWLPEKLALQVESLRRRPECGLAYGRWYLSDEAGNRLEEAHRHQADGWVFKDLLREHNFLCTMSLPLMRTELVREVGGFDPVTDTADDLDLFLRIARVAQFAFLPEFVLEYNVGNHSQQTLNLWRTYRANRVCMNKQLGWGAPVTLADRLAVGRTWGEIYAPAFRERGWHELRAGDFAKAWRSYGEAVKLRPQLLVQADFLRDVLALAKRSAQWKRTISS